MDSLDFSSAASRKLYSPFLFSNVTTTIPHKLLMHAAMVFQMMPELKATPMGEIGGNMLQRRFFQMLPTDFTKQEAVKQAEVLGIAKSTMGEWLRKYTESSHIERVAHGQYHKINWQKGA